jgi:FKBP-type peptidyl-prolyl cis-trans isomerase
MKIIIPFALSIAIISCNNKSQETIELTSGIDSVSYAIGSSIASSIENQNKQIKEQSPEINIDMVNQSILSNLNSSSEPMIDSATSQQIIESFFKKKQAEQQEQARSEMAPKIKEGEEFLAKNGTKEGVTTTASGLQYEIITQGSGAKPALTDEVETHYHGTLLDGTVFDSSVDRGQSISFPVNGVIPGWTEALQLMSVGSKWKLYVPYNLAYGERGEPRGGIAPYSTLIFEVELLGIK